MRRHQGLLARIRLIRTRFPGGPKFSGGIMFWQFGPTNIENYVNVWLNWEQFVLGAVWLCMLSQRLSINSLGKTKINPKRNEKQDPSWIAFWRDLGANLVPKWRQVGEASRAQMGPRGPRPGLQQANAQQRPERLSLTIGPSGQGPSSSLNGPRLT